MFAGHSVPFDLDLGHNDLGPLGQSATAFRRCLGRHGEPCGPQNTFGVRVFYVWLGAVTASIASVQPRHARRRWAQQRLRVPARLMEVRRSRCRVHDHRVRRGRLLLAADRARRLRLVCGRQRCSLRLASAWGSILERLLRTDCRQSVFRRRAAALRAACCVSWQRP